MTALAEVRRELSRADCIAAYDKARVALEAGSTDPELRYLSVLALARAGATARAASRYRQEMLHLVRRGVVPEGLWVDCRTLWARIRKDVALAAPPAERAHLLRRAARRYRSVYAESGRSFPGINAATLLLLCGDAVAAEALAAELLHLPELAEPAGGYWAAATRAEALIVLGRWDGAARALTRARALAQEDYGQLSSTRRQLGMLLDTCAPAGPLPRDLLALVALPVVCHFGGCDIPEEAQRSYAGAVAAALEEGDVGFGVGTLGTSGALLAAEQILARGAELHLVLPFGEADFLAGFGDRAPGGDRDRRRRCLEEAATVTAATADGDFPDPGLIGYAERIAAGLAETRARSLTTACRHLDCGPGAPVLRDRPPRGGSGALSGGALSGGALPSGASPEAVPPRTGPGDVREIRAFLFADVFRFSAIPESRLPEFWSEFMAGVAGILAGRASDILYRNTWGDALFLVVADIEAAADLALAIQERVTAMRRRNRHSPELRIGLHHGPVFRGWDPIRDVPSYFGTQVSRAARVEPIAPPGTVFVTEPFAAILATTGTNRFEAEYVGRVPLAKGYGEYRMYRLARRWAG